MPRIAAKRSHSRLGAEPGGGTRVHVRIAYEPPAGALGRLVAASLGADPARWLRGDLLRLKRQLEAETGGLAALDHQMRTRSAGAL